METIDPKYLREKLKEINSTVDTSVEGKPASAPTPVVPPAAPAPSAAPAGGPAPTKPATVAQGTEQGTSKPLAAGSIPAGGATSDDKVIGIIGSAGRGAKGPDGKYVYPEYTKQMFDGWVDYASKVVPADATVVSGGAAWADHVAVRLYTTGKIKKLVLFLPAELIDTVGMTGVGNAQAVFRSRAPRGTKSSTAAWTANNYHKIFSEKIGVDTLDEMLKAIEKGSLDGSVDVHVSSPDSQDPFKDRNTEVAKAAKDGLIAFTDVNEDGSPIDGGTSDTWTKHSKMYPNARRIAKPQGIREAYANVPGRRIPATTEDVADAPADVSATPEEAGLTADIVKQKLKGAEPAPSAPAEAPAIRATSGGMAPGDVPVPPQRETTPSVAPRAIYGESGNRGRIIYVDRLETVPEIGRAHV